MNLTTAVKSRDCTSNFAKSKIVMVSIAVRAEQRTMTKAEAWDILSRIVTDGVNCWERGGETDIDEPKVCLAYLTGVVEALNEAVNK